MANGSSGDGGTPQQPKSSALPHSLEEALRVCPQAEENILRYIRYTHQKSEDDPQFRVSIDDEIHQIFEIDECVGGRSSSGFALTELKYELMPGSDTELWVNRIEVYNSNLSRRELDIFTACLHSKVMHRRMPITEPQFKRGILSHRNFAWPIDDSDVFQFLETGDWPGLATPRN
jgi:hypothetical protein